MISDTSHFRFISIAFCASSLFLISCGNSFAAVQLPPIFSDGMVLQRDRPLPVWGTAVPGEKITVSLRGQQQQTEAADDGRWQVTLQPEAASTTAVELHVSGENTVTIGNVLIGDVWLCVGQSNMELPLHKTRDSSAEIASASHPMIRQFLATRKSAETPASQVNGAWQTCSPESAGEFSAVAYYFARDLQAKTGVPIGILNFSWGGTRIEAWVNAKVRDDARLAYDRAMSRYREEKPAIKFLPSGIHNAMMQPLYPLAVRGIVWYQGESNARFAEDYAPLFVEMIRQWREGFQQPELPFYFVQLPGYDEERDPSGLNWARLREAQAKALELPETRMIVTIDLGEHDRIHPVRNKSAIAGRIVGTVLNDTRAEKKNLTGPVFRSAVPDGGAMRVSFEPGTQISLKGSDGFELAGADRVFHPATAQVADGAVVVSSEAVPQPEAVRYAWSNAPGVSLFDSDGNPAAPFRSDLW